MTQRNHRQPRPLEPPLTDVKYGEEITLLPDAEAAEYVALIHRQIRSHRERFRIPVIGIAGTEGKTTTKRMLSAILSPVMRVLETEPYCATTHGVTSTLVKLDDSYDAAILELGIIKPDQFRLAVDIARPTIGVITNIGESHLAAEGDKYLIADAKVDLIRNLPASGYAVLNIDDDLVSGMAKFSTTPRIIKFGFNKNAQFYASRIRYLGPDGIRFLVNGHYDLHLPVFGSTAIYNALTAIAIARVLNIDFDVIQEGLATRFSMPEHSGNLLREKDLNILDYTYDATINSVTKACESLVQFKPFARKLILAIGDISNPGPDPEGTHLKMGYYIAAMPIDMVVTVGPNARLIGEGIQRINHTRKRLDHCADGDHLVETLAGICEPGDALLVIGSRDLRLNGALTHFRRKVLSAVAG